MALDTIANLATTATTGTADSGTADTLVDNALTQANDYWNHYVLTITGGTNSGYSRIVYDFDAANDRIKVLSDFPAAIDNTSVYSLSPAPLAGTQIRPALQRNIGNLTKIVLVDVDAVGVGAERYVAIGQGRGKARETCVLQVVCVLDDHIGDVAYTAAQQKANWEDWHNLTAQVRSVLSHNRELTNQGYLGRFAGTQYLHGPWAAENDKWRLISRVLMVYESETVVG